MREKARVTIQQLREFGHHAAASPPLMATGHKDYGQSVSQSYSSFISMITISSPTRHYSLLYLVIY